MFGAKKRLIVHELIGEGLNAKVYKACEHDKEYGLEQIYALKVLKRKEDLGHFKREFQNLLKVSGKRVVKFRGWRRYKSKPALLLEYIEGVTLYELAQNFKLSENELKWMYSEILMGLKELKESFLFHGDLSPKNIMVDLYGHIKLIDFGLTTWRTRKMELTPEFACPDVLSGARSPSYDTDLASLNLMFEKLGWATQSLEQGTVLTPPLSLSQKVLSLIKKDSGTLDTTAGFAPTGQKKRRLLKVELFTLSVVFVLFPFKTSNLFLKPHRLHIRSLSWLSVKTDFQKSWCFSPCILNFSSGGTQTLYWKTQKKSGSFKVFLKKPNSTLQFDP